MQYLLHPARQAELQDIFVGGHATSLEVERKHFQDKPGGLPVTISLATASRNSVIKRYRVHGQRAVKKVRQQEKECHGDRYANVRAVALQRRPDLMPRARGWRFGDIERPASAPQLLHGDSSEKLAEYIEVVSFFF